MLAPGNAVIILQALHPLLSTLNCGSVKADTLFLEPVFKVAHIGIEDIFVVVGLELFDMFGEFSALTDDFIDLFFEFITNASEGFEIYIEFQQGGKSFKNSFLAAGVTALDVGWYFGNEAENIEPAGRRGFSKMIEDTARPIV